MSDDIRLRPCPRCGGQPIVLVWPSWPYPALQVECDGCKLTGAWIYFDNKAPGREYGESMLPGLNRAREQAAVHWNSAMELRGKDWNGEAADRAQA